MGDTEVRVPRALVVEDARDWQHILSELLEEMGLHVDIAADKPRAVHLVRQHPYRLAIIDISLRPLDPHNQDGLHVLEFIHRHAPMCVPILLTGYATVDLAVSAFTQYGVFTLLRKETFSRREFRDVVRRALARAPLNVLGVSHGSPQPSPPSPRVSSKELSAGLALIVEDDAGWQSILAELVTEAGYRPRVCRGYAEALGRLRRERPALAIVDLSLRGPFMYGENKDGFRLLTATRDAGIPTIVVSGIGAPEDVETAYREQDVFAYVEKQTFDRHAFLELLAEAQEMVRRRGSPLDTLTPRERQVLDLLAQGMTNRQIADALVISPNTVKRHLKAIFEKLGVNTRAAAVAKRLEYERFAQ